MKRADCHEKIERIEEHGRDSIYVCDNDDTFESNFADNYRMHPDLSQKNQCGRSYMSRRDLLAHIKHRHESE